jgi:putative MFS transporter
MGITDHLRPPQPLERREIALLGVFALLAFTQGWSGAAITHVLPFVQEDFGLDDAAIFDLMAVVRAVALLALVLSWWGDRHGRRRPLLASFLLLVGANLLTVAAPGAVGFTAIQAVARIGTIGLGALAVVVLSEEVAPRVRSYALGIYALVGALGTGFGLLVRPLGEGGDDWRLLFALSAVPLLAFPFAVRAIGESRAYSKPTAHPPLGAVLRPGLAARFWPMAGLSFAVSLFTSPAANLALVRLENDLGWSAAAASLLLAGASGPGVAIGLLAGGRVADTLGRRPTEVVAILVGVAGGVAFYFLETGWLVGAAIFVSTLGAFGFGPAFAAHRSELFPTEVRATAGSWIINASIVGGLAGFAAGRFVVDAWGTPATMAVLGGVLVAATGLVWLLPETKGDETDPWPPIGAMPA